MNDTMQRNTYPVYSLQPLANGKDYLLCIENGLKLPLPNGNLSTVVWHVTQELHCHDFWEICFVVKGSSIQHFLDRSENMHVGSVYIMRPHDVHCISPLQKEMPQNIQSAPYIHRDIYIPCDKMEKICNALREDLYDDLLSRKYPLSSVLPESEISHLEATLNSFNDTENFAFMHSVIVSHILCSVLESQRYPTSQLPAWITELLINLNREDFMTKNIQAIVQTTGYNQSYVCRQFKKYVNQTLVEYIHKRKCTYSLLLLPNIDISIAQIAQRLQFSDESAFIKIFKSIYTITPGQWRKNHRKFYQTAPFQKITPDGY